MQIILNEDMEALGKAGEIVTVKPGFARNYLIPQGIATVATKKNIESTKKNLEIQERKDARTRTNLEALAERLNKLTLKFELQAGEDDKLFGSVTNSEISKELSSEGFEIEKKCIQLSSSIKKIGSYTAKIRLHREVYYDLNFDVVSSQS